MPLRILLLRLKMLKIFWFATRFVPITIPSKSKFDEYYPALDEYTKTGKIDKLTELFASLLVEVLYRRIAKLTAKKIVPAADYGFVGVVKA